MTEGVNHPLVEGQFAINVIQNSDNKLLLLKRGADTKIGPNRWGFSSGHIEQEETPDQCSLRELNEELGSDYKLELLDKFGPVMDRFYGGKYQLFLFHFRWCHGDITLNHEHTDYTWVGKEEFRNYDVVDGIDEDIFYFDIWPNKYLNQTKLPDFIR
jgi:8-oxo-dGTP pyrophosphatase MutT (NUDIX family)